MSVVARLLDARLGPGKPLRALAGSGQLGYGVPEPALKAGLARAPHFLGCDMGSVDPGPYYLGAGKMGTAEAVTLRDLRLVIHGARQVQVPLLIGTAGTAGAAPHVAETLALIRRIAKEDGLKLRVAVVHADIDRGWLKGMVAAGRTRGLGGALPALDPATIDGASHIVGQMGTEAFLRALKEEPDIVLAGRACDTAIFSAIPALLGYDQGPATHMAKIIECCSICCVPGGRDAMLGTLHGEWFELESMNPARAATPVSVAAHGLYEQADPLAVHEPDGTVDLSAARFTALDGRRVRVEGAVWKPAAHPTIKLEGATWCGERAITLAGSCDPRVIEHREAILAGVRRQVAEIVPEAAEGGPCRLDMRVYGAGATALFPNAAMDLPVPGEVFFLLEALAPTADLAKSIATVSKQYLLHHGFPGRLSTGGNVAFPFTPPEISCGAAYRFSIYHLTECDDLAAVFPVQVETVG